ncbi:hypothetical protein LAZ67_10000990 [Cordylochernes scorpioides]|uniref:Integrase catalytic domain-containing protein n=1 Tax=Cordylochernes scorpioides TaxID=51811 RepID=A0ABY6KVF9_9ARAC|nr:hypothetical protein LAZ67_10000990 [Cordylochernes scorpioides]
MMRDRFVAGIKSEILQKKVLQEDDDVTLDKVFAVAISFELAEINIRELQDKLVAKISPGETDATINLTVDDYYLCFTIDTGSPVTLIPKDIYKNYWQDNGRQFVSGEFEQFTKMNDIRHTKTSPYNPSTNGLAERYVREFKNLLRKNNGKDDLETNLQSFLFAHRAFPQTVIKEFPRGTANEEKFKNKILEFNTKIRNPREVFHEAVRRQEQFTTGCELYFRNYATGPKRGKTPLFIKNLRESTRAACLAEAVVLRGTTTPFSRLTPRSARRALERPRLAAQPITRLLSRWTSVVDALDWTSLRRCVFSGHDADIALRLALHALPHPNHPASTSSSCQACGSVDRSLDLRYWSCSRIRPLIIEAFSVLGRSPDLRAWIFGSGIEDDDLAILASAKSIIYRYFVQKQFDEADSNKEGIATRKKHSRRSDRVRGEEFVKNVKEKIDGIPGKSMRAIAKEMDVGSMTIVRTIHEDLGLKSYALRKGQLLTENMKNNRKGKAAALLNNLKHDSFGMLRFFSDEKNFDVDQKVNPRNDRWICKDPSEIPVVMHTKFPASVMVLGVISSEGDVMPPHFFEKGLRMNADTYINVLETVVKPWMDMVAAGRNHWGPDIWPPNSPDCNPLDYYVWGVVERDVNKAPHTTIQSVKKAVHTVMTQMDKVIVAKACASFRTRLETVVANNGNYIE